MTNNAITLLTVVLVTGCATEVIVEESPAPPTSSSSMSTGSSSPGTALVAQDCVKRWPIVCSDEHPGWAVECIVTGCGEEARVVCCLSPVCPSCWGDGGQPDVGSCPPPGEACDGYCVEGEGP